MSKYVCVFCDERKDVCESGALDGKIGICRNCYERLARTAPSSPYAGSENINYILSPFEYKKGIRRVIIDFKFHGCRAYAGLLAYLMRDYLDSYDIWGGFDCIVPVPLHKKRFKERGYNQSELLAEHVSEYLSVPMRAELLSRIRATKKQSTLEGSDRITNVAGSFSCAGGCKGQSILLFDDICTTGNTLKSCAAELTKAGAKRICALTLAIHTEQKLPVITY